MRRVVSHCVLASVLSIGLLQLPACGTEQDFVGPSDDETNNEGGAGGTSSGGKSSGGGKSTGGDSLGGAASGGDSSGGAASGGAASGGDSSGGAASGGASPGGGGDSSGGTGGSGGSLTVLAPLGASCEAGSECDSSECSGGVCCESECDGVCETCNAEGRCVAAEGDTACPAVSCGTGENDCLTYGASLEGGTCKSKGVCKTSDDCPSTPVPANTACEIPGSEIAICDGEGECTLPTVTCGGSCTIGSNLCCYMKNDTAVSFQCTSSCPATFLSAVPARTPVRCDDHADCRTGYLCSLLSASGGSGIQCRDGSVTTSAGANYDGTYQDNYEVCLSPTMSQRTCSNGGTCAWTQPNFPGWKFCNHN